MLLITECLSCGVVLKPFEIKWENCIMCADCDTCKGKQIDCFCGPCTCGCLNGIED